ncbi:uncharacterized protein Z519_03699 [Cladophialophora bantiana CBS 173.52]|uniref:RlpA-like protein double-psi beta-barrel domain-containing protein n=1 Tax=Cladophialophora bantiana (strain ATCC 10958 / CBS 173.52 / CDC B-1940 / NIH 8579) TaxID=1442370 RepID=A0A0D2HVY6_CLAB1|nr:uncharacterized protein Z519_03699 [Cladophialophora bantiana CBS 173.52]KIW95115.1 hypothetical protein Z519_03699 [Cladophialophora bantiana CBS 173.52]
MAGLKNIVLATSLLTSLVAAVPMLDKRAIYTNTVTEIAWVTVEETTTIWVDPSDPTPAPAPAVSTTSSVPAAVFAAATYTPSTLATAAIVPVEAPSSSSAAPVAPSPATSSSAVAPSAPASSPPAAPSSAPAPSMVNVQPKDTVGTDGTCEGSGDACQGDVTHWDGGLGACGWNVNTNSDMQIALPYAFMGTQSNGNPYCGRSVTLYNPTSGTTVQATVGDKCMGCLDRAIDCTDALFNAITDGTGDGRVSGIQWWLN